jgi:hypothetical protein
MHPYFWGKSSLLALNNPCGALYIVRCIGFQFFASRLSFGGSYYNRKMKTIVTSQRHSDSRVSKKRKLSKSPPPCTQPRHPKIKPESITRAIKYRSQADFCRQGNPWIKYHKFTEEDQAGITTIAHVKKPSFYIVAIKETRMIVHSRACGLIKTLHPNLVNLIEAYLDTDRLFLVYEDLDVSHVSLADIGDSRLNEIEIATICKGVSRSFC